MSERERIIKILDRQGSLVRGDDGSLVFWPHEKDGAYTATHLRWIAQIMDRENGVEQPTRKSQ